MLREWDQWAARVEGERTQNGNRYQDTLLGGPLLEKEYKKYLKGIKQKTLKNIEPRLETGIAMF